MVTTRASSRESTPAASVRGTTYSERLRTSARRSTSIMTDGGTPSSKSRAKKAGPTTAARSGNSSNAYGGASQAYSSRNAARNQQGFSSAFDDVLVEQETEEPEQGPEPEPEESTALSPIGEEERHSTRASTPVSHASSSSSTSPTALALAAEAAEAAFHGKSFSTKREQGLTINHPKPLPFTARDFPQHMIIHPTTFERIGAAISGFVNGTKAFFNEFLNGAKVFFNDYWKLILGLFLALAFGSLLAVFDVPNISPVFSSPAGSVSSPVFPSGDMPAVTTTVVSYVPNPSDRVLASRLNHLESRVSFLEDELSRSRAGTTLTQLPFNHLSASIGATILPGITSPTKRTYSSWLIPLSKLWSPTGMKGPITALQSWTEPGQCWCTPADRAALGVRAPYPVQAGAVTIEHVLPEHLTGSGADVGTAPKTVEVWARVGAGEEEKGECLGAAPEKGRGWSCLGRLEVAHHVRDVRSWTMDLAVDHVVATDFAFVALENAGNKEATCLYRVQLHGTKA